MRLCCWQTGDSEMLEELRRNGAEQIDLLIVESYAPLQAEGTLELLREYPPLQVAAPDSGAVTSYLEAVCDAPITSREQIGSGAAGGPSALLSARYGRGSFLRRYFALKVSGCL